MTDEEKSEKKRQNKACYWHTFCPAISAAAMYVLLILFCHDIYYELCIAAYLLAGGICNFTREVYYQGWWSKKQRTVYGIVQIVVGIACLVYYFIKD